MQPGRPVRREFEYIRHGTLTLMGLSTFAGAGSSASVDALAMSRWLERAETAQSAAEAVEPEGVS
jgi:hypothetical protein